jgi:glycosyltransferase involved in cell wall biosynthesis
MVRELGSGGIERDVTKLAVGLDRSRFTPYVATYQPNGIRQGELKRAEVPVIHLQVSSFKSPKLISTAVEFGRFIRKQRIRIVHAFDSTAVFGVPLARFLGVPVVLASTLGHRALLDRRTRRQFQFTDRLVDAIVVNCKAMREHLIKDFSISGDRIELCYNGVDTKEFHPSKVAVAKPNCVAGANVVIGTVCVLRPEKGLEILQEAFAKAHRTFPHTKLLIVGSGPELEKLKRNSARLSIEDACTVMPAVSEVAPFMQAIDIFVSSSYSEAFSNSILEAMASGCCVVGSRVGGTPELITDRESGLLFTTGDAEELAQRLVELIQDATLRRTLGNKAAEFAARTLNMEIAARRTMEIYDDVLCRKTLLGHPVISS